MYDNTNSGALFRNERKETDKQPDYKGSLNVNGTDYWVSGWIRESGPMARNPGSKFMSLALTAKDTPASAPASGYKNDPDDDDIPF